MDVLDKIAMLFDGLDINEETNKKPKFKMGDRVSIANRGKILYKGKITYGPQFDEFLGEHRYKVTHDEEFGGDQKWWNESSLKRIK